MGAEVGVVHLLLLRVPLVYTSVVGQLIYTNHVYLDIYLIWPLGLYDHCGGGSIKLSTVHSSLNKHLNLKPILQHQELTSDLPENFSMLMYFSV